jgi:hypothetical protein
MRNRFLGVLLGIFAIIALQAQSFQDTPEKENSREVVSRPSFIRMDLLRTEKKPLPPAHRSIFTAGRSGSPSVDSGRLQEDIAGVVETGGVQKSPPGEYLDLQYIGYVRSGTKIVALIIFQGEALAVVEGELIAERLTVKRIGLEEIEIIGPDSKPHMFFLEGEKP